MNHKIFLLFVLLPFFFGACKSTSTKEKQDNEEIIPVKLAPLQQQYFSTSFKTTGYFTTNNETPLSFKNGGIIQNIYVEEGDAIKKGQVLATVYGTEVQSATQQAELAYQKAKRDYERAKDLYLDSVTTLEQKQNAKTALEIAQQQKEAAIFNKNHSEIRAVESGFVLKKLLQKGQAAAPGQPVLLVNGTAHESWIFKTDVSDYQWAAIQPGDSAEITTDVKPHTILPAKVMKKSKGVNTQTGAFTLQLKVENLKDIHPASGLFGKATLYPSLEKKGWAIPYNALLDADRNQGFVFVTNDKKTVEKKKVHISAIHAQKVIVNKGLDSAQYLIVSGSPYLQDHSAIKVAK